jgi:hypothetical protein
MVSRKFVSTLIALAIGVSFKAVNLCQASEITAVINTTNGGEPAKATADLTFGNGTLTVVLTNSAVNPHAAGSLLGGVSFKMSGSPGTPSSVSNSGSLIDIAGDGSTSLFGGNAASELDNWSFTATGNPDIFRVSGNDPLIIGYGDGGLPSSSYDNANSSLTNGSHDPYIQNAGTFVYNIPGVTTSTTASNFSFLFGTTFTSFSNDITVTTNLPSPTTTPLLGVIGAFCLLLRRRNSMTAAH